MRYRDRLPLVWTARRGEQFRVRTAASWRRAPVVYRRRGHRRLAAAAGAARIAGVVGTGCAGADADARNAGATGGAPERILRGKTGAVATGPAGRGQGIPAEPDPAACADRAARC